MRTLRFWLATLSLVFGTLSFGPTTALALTCTSQSSPSVTSTTCSDGTTSLAFQSGGVTQTLDSDGASALSTQTGASTFSTGTDGVTTTIDDGGLQVSTTSDGTSTTRACLGNGISTASAPSISPGPPASACP